MQLRTFLRTTFGMVLIVGGVMTMPYLSFAKEQEKTMNPAVYFEIPVSNIQRAMTFYEAVFGYDFTRETIHGNQMAFFPLHENAPGITGALAQGEVYQPSQQGVILYLGVNDLDAVLKRAQHNGAKILFPKTDTNGFGWVAEIEDSEGNRIGLSQK